MTAIERMPDSWWLDFGEECICGVPGDACVLLRHIEAEEAEIARLVAGDRDLVSLWEVQPPT